MKKYVKIKIYTDKKSTLLVKLNKINVDIKNILYLNDSLVMDIDSLDLKRVKKYLVSYKVEIVSSTGIYKFINILKKNSLLLISIIFSLIIFYILTNIIVKVNIVHQDSYIRSILNDALEKRGIRNLSFKKSYDEYEKIISEILDEYPDKIEWLEIDVEGMIINVRVEERIINNFKKEYKYCHVVAKKSGLIRSIRTTKGVQQVSLNSHVDKGDILINGQIKLNEEIKNNVCASGEVMAEVWYNVNVSLPLVKKDVQYTGKKRLNFMIKKDNKEYVVLKSRVKMSEQKNKLLFKIFGIEFYLQEEYEIKNVIKKYSEKEAFNEAKKLVYEKLNVNGVNNSDIINEKVLKKSLNNGNLNIEMFVAIKEQIGGLKYYEIEESSDISDKQNNGNNN